MSTRLLMCGFSHHTEPFLTEAENGLNALFDPLADGRAAHALVDGKMRIVEAGDLLLVQPLGTLPADDRQRQKQPVQNSTDRKQRLFFVMSRQLG